TIVSESSSWRIGDRPQAVRTSDVHGPVWADGGTGSQRARGVPAPRRVPAGVEDPNRALVTQVVPPMVGPPLLQSGAADDDRVPSAGRQQRPRLRAQLVRPTQPAGEVDRDDPPGMSTGLGS